MRQNGFGTVIAIDPYSAESSIKGMTGENLEWWAKQDHEAKMRYFLARIDEHDIGRHVQFIRKSSNDVEPQEGISFLHVDGNHSEQSVTDVKRFASKVVLGGLVFADDISWEGGGVNKSLTALLELGFMELYRVQKPGDDWAVFQRIFNG